MAAPCAAAERGVAYLVFYIYLWVGACALKVFCGVCFGESVVGVYFGVGYSVTVTRFVLINIRRVLMTGSSYVNGEVITILL